MLVAEDDPDADDEYGIPKDDDAEADELSVKRNCSTGTEKRTAAEGFGDGEEG